ncbi:MAG TPA: gephyrin-like molybdotransferase Glp [Candidatus Angelobacter sp.]|nr:gephyrin-like molybdotransferase Glp [Candidatus Angelobacter sp.]
MASIPKAETVLPFEQAHKLVLDYCGALKPIGSEEVPILQALGRVVAEPISADRDFPPFPRATRDGYALRSSDLKALPTRLQVIGQAKAGAGYVGGVSEGQAVEIMTGAPVPWGADAVVMVEHTTMVEHMTNDDSPSDGNAIQGGFVSVHRPGSPGENVVPPGSEARAGQQMIPAGTRMGFAQVAVASAAGKTTLQVYKKPRVSILATGDELVDAAAIPSPHQIRNSNSYSLASQVMLSGGEPLPMPVTPDDLDKLRTAIDEGLLADMLLLTGGVSMGKFDLVEQALTELGARFFFTGVLIQPGKPVVFGEIHDRRRGKTIPFFGLPGNPVSTMVTFELFAGTVLEALSGSAPARLPSAKARLAKEIKTKTGLARFLPASLTGDLLDAQVELVPWQGSGDIMASAQANCYIVVPPDREFIGAGEMVSILMRTCPR